MDPQNSGNAGALPPERPPVFRRRGVSLTFGIRGLIGKTRGHRPLRHFVSQGFVYRLWTLPFQVIRSQYRNKRKEYIVR